MNARNIKRHLCSKLDDWVKHIGSEEIQKIVKQNAIVTGGSIVSLLNNEQPHDYDVYFKTKEACFAVASYYAKLFSKAHKNRNVVVEESEEGRITCFIEEKEATAEDSELLDKEERREPEAKNKSRKKKKYMPKYFTTNAISLSDKIQLVIRFYGSVEEIHKNYDFAHCTCSYDYQNGGLDLPSKALECIINKELYYIGSKYPLCSIIRTRKFINRGYHVNAGQILKMAMQLNDLDLKDFAVLKDQLVGVDSLYFGAFIEDMEKMKEQNPGFNPDTGYFIEAINRIFN